MLQIVINQNWKCFEAMTEQYAIETKPFFSLWKNAAYIFFDAVYTIHTAVYAAKTTK